MDEKTVLGRHLAGVPADTLPPPTTAPQVDRKRKVRRLFLFSLISALAIWSLGNHNAVQDSSAALSTLSEEFGDASAYFTGIASKGYRLATGLTKEKHGHHGKDKGHKHEGHGHGGHQDHHGHEGHHGHGKGKHGCGHHGLPHYIPPKEAEEIFLSVPTNQSVRDALKRYTGCAHPAGSGYDYASALNLKNEWERLLGLSVSGPEENVYDAGDGESQARIKGGMSKMGVWVDTYYPVMNDPVSSSVTLMTDPPFKAKLQEDIVEGDPDSVLRDAVRVFHGLSVSGDVTGQVVYAGYGRKSDFEMLQAQGVDFTGKIALVKYWEVFRGLKIKAAQEAGAIGCIIFTDPGDDGEFTEANGYELYPDGPARQPSSVQRGSVQFISKFPGDPTTPGEPAYPNATRHEGLNQPSIPSLPISYQDAIPILKALEGKGMKAEDVKADWVGGLGFYGVEYWTGPSDVDLHFVNEVNTRVMPIWNTMATIPGHITDEVIILGNHRDAWVLGASDPNSGTASQHELIRGLGKLLSKGWKPMRTIVLASWDAEEYGLIGSCEWAEDFGDWLSEYSAIYLNLDSSVSGSNYGAAASPSLAWLMRNTAEEIMSSADETRSIWDSKGVAGDWKAWKAEVYGEEDIDPEILFQSETGVETLGSGSDFTAFLQRYGIASGSNGFGNGPKDPVYHYHSIYDSFHWMEKFGDPGFHRHADTAKILGVILLRAADSLILPINTTQYAIELELYLKKVEYIAKDLELTEGLDLEPLHGAIEGLVKASEELDETKVAAVKKLHELLPKPGHHGRPKFFSSVARAWWTVRAAFGSQKAIERLAHIRLQGDLAQNGLSQIELWNDAEMSESEAPQWPEFPSPKLPKFPSGPHMPNLPKHGKMGEIKKVLEEIRGINKKLQYFEGGFISEEGIKEREWYKHKGVAPGIWLGYGATTFPALTEALTIDHSTELAQKEADELTDMLKAMAKRLKA